MIQSSVILLTNGSPFLACGSDVLATLSQSGRITLRITLKSMKLERWHELVYLMQYLLVEREVVMKTALLRTITLITITATFVGCGSGKGKLNSSTAAPGVVTTPPVVTPDPGTGSAAVAWPYSVSGDTVAFVPVSWQEMNSYVGLRPLNNPTNAMINLNFKPIDGLNIHSGTVRIGYTDTGKFWYGEFNAGSAKNQNCQNCQNNNDYESAYNYWTTVNGKRTFMAFVQDQYGALIVVLEDGLGTGDASGSSILSGRVFYRNFAQSIYPQSPYRKCWYIYSGPYACYSKVMAEKSSSTSIDGFTLLGSFSGVQSYKVFQ